MARYASATRVPVDQTRTEIERTLTRYGATAFGYTTRQGQAVIGFEAGERRMRITVPLPMGDSDKERQEARARWRALLLVIKAKLESVESGIETLEEAFYANVVMPDNRTVYEATKHNVAIAYSSGKVQALLPDYSKN